MRDLEFDKKEKRCLSNTRGPRPRRLLYEVLNKPRGMGLGGCVGSAIFFPLADFILVFELSFPSTPRPQDNVTTLGGLSFVFFAWAPFEGETLGCLGLPSPDAERSEPQTLHLSGSIRPLGRSTRTALSSGH